MVKSDGATSCSGYGCGGSLLSVINKECNITGIQYTSIQTRRHRDLLQENISDYID